jgi:hypothetical protein
VNDPMVWFAESTAGAPEALRARAREFVVAASGDDLPERFARAGRAALAEATREGGCRAAALDLLAADALITLALLVTAQRNPGSLASVARELRAGAVAA